MTSLNSKRSGGFSRAKGSNNVSNSRNQPSFGGKRMEGFGANKMTQPAKKHTGTCSKCQKKCKSILIPTPAKPLCCSNCSPKK